MGNSIVVALLVVCSLSWSAMAMLDGLQLNAFQYSWLAGLLTNEWMPRCSGTVITDHFVITAAACVMYKNNVSFEILNPNDYIVVVPSLDISIRNIDTLLPHPDIYHGFFVNVALIGVRTPFLLDKSHTRVMPIWPGTQQWPQEVDDVLNIIGYMSCEVVTWNNIATPMDDPERLDHHQSNYPIRQFVSFAEVTVVHPDICISKLCKKSSNPPECSDKLNETLCATIIEPKEAMFCGADRGAGLTCMGDYLWGVFVGGASCTNNKTEYAVFVRIDKAIDFIDQSRTFYPDHARSRAPEMYLAKILVGLKYMVSWLSHYSVYYIRCTTYYNTAAIKP